MRDNKELRRKLILKYVIIVTLFNQQIFQNIVILINTNFRLIELKTGKKENARKKGEIKRTKNCLAFLTGKKLSLE